MRRNRLNSSGSSPRGTGRAHQAFRHGRESRSPRLPRTRRWRRWRAREIAEDLSALLAEERRMIALERLSVSTADERLEVPRPTVLLPPVCESTMIHIP